MAELNQAFPSLDLTLDDITLVHYGAVPARVKTDGRISLEGHERIRDHAQAGLDGLLSVAGAKYTTARAVAERVTDRVVSKLRSTADRVQNGVGLASRREHPRSHVGHCRSSSSARPRASQRYHSSSGRGLRISISSRSWRSPRNASGWRARVADDSPVIGAELVWAVRHEMALTLSDAVIRRTPLGAVGCPGEPALQRAADLIGSELGWSDEHSRQEMEDVRRFYSTAARGQGGPSF